jgi:hypothetical protein
MACSRPPPEATVTSSQPTLRHTVQWYVRPAVEARSKPVHFALLGLVAVAGCGGGERQDEDEPEGRFAVEVVEASFPQDQKLAKSSDLEITVRNAGGRTIPNIAMTLSGLTFRKTDPGLSDPERPQFVINGVPKQIGGFPEAKEAAPIGCDTAYVSTWACGPLGAGREKTFRWSVTAVKAGPFNIRYKVAAGLDGKAKAIAPGGGAAPRGGFAGTVSDEAPEVRVADDGETVVSGTR